MRTNEEFERRTNEEVEMLLLVRVEGSEQVKPAIKQKSLKAIEHAVLHVRFWL